MDTRCSSEAVFTLEKAGQELGSLMLESQREIEAAGKAFEDLAHQTDAILGLAAGVIGCVEDKSVRSILPKVQSLGVEVRSFIEEKLRATTGILETATAEAQLLDQLCQLTRGQRSIARETQVLSVLTNIEVARLDRLGAGFAYLAQQLDGFSQSVAQGTKELTAHTGERKAAIEETRRMLAADLPGLDRELLQIEADLGVAFSAVDAGLTRLRSRQAGAVPGCLCGDRARRQHHAGRDSSAHRGRQPHSGPDLKRQDR